MVLAAQVRIGALVLLTGNWLRMHLRRPSFELSILCLKLFDTQFEHLDLGEEADLTLVGT